MVGLDGVDNDRIFLVLPGQVRAQLDVAALHLVVDGLAQIMQQSRPLGHGHVHTQFRGNEPGNVGHLDGVVQNVLAIGGAVLLAAQNLDELGVEVVHPRLVAGPLALLPDGTVHFLAGLLHHVLDAGGVDAAVHNELFQGQTGHLPADRVEGGHGDGLRRIVNDQIHPGDGLQGADISALPADDPALHLVVGQGHHGDGGLGGVVGGAALDGGGDDLPGFLLGLVLELALDLLDLHGRVVADVRLHALQQILLGLLLGEAGDLLQDLRLLAAQLLGLGLDFRHLLQLLGGFLFLALAGLGFLVQGGFLLFQTALLFGQLRPAFLNFPFVLCA